MSNLQEAPSIRIQHHRPGDRRLSEAQLKARERAKSFDGLPDGITPGHVLAAFKQAASALGIAPRFVHAVDWLFGFTRPQDWQAPSRPIVWPSSGLQMSRLQLERTAIKTLNRALAELGLVVMQDSPTGKRYGRRDRMGRIVEAYGFDLSILAVRYDEFRAIADQARAEYEARKALRRRIGAASKRVRQCLAVARERGLVWRELAEHEAAIECMLEEAKGRVYSELTTNLTAIAEAIERRRDTVEKWLNSAVYSTYTDPKAVHIPTPHIPTNPYPIDNTTIVVEAQQVDKSTPAASSPNNDVREVRGREGQASDRISAGELLGLSPLLAAHMLPGCRQPKFTDIVEAAYRLRHELGISPALWGRACNEAVMGRETAAIALAIIAARPPGHIKSSAGGYFMGMVRKAEAGKLDLQSSIAKLRHDLSSALSR